MQKLMVIILLLLIISGAGYESEAKVFMKRDEALSTAFPEASEIKKNEIFLTPEESREIESVSRSKNDSKLYIIYEAVDGDRTLGYAIIDTHTLRTKTETVMFVINPDGTLRQSEILAFFEPPDYQAGDNWIELFEGKSAEDGMKIGKDVPNITGATITANSLSQAIRRVLAVFKLVSDNGKLN